MPRECPPASPRGTGAEGGLRSVITRHPELMELQHALIAELGIILATPAVQYLLDVVTIALATWHGRLCRGGHQVEILGDVVDLLIGATGKLAGDLRAESLAEARAWRDRAACAETGLWAVLDATGMFHRAARAHFGVPGTLHTAVATALVLPPELGGAKWQAARSPVGLVIDAARRHHQTDDLRCGGGAIPRSDALGRGTMRLEQIADFPGEAVLARRFTERSLDELMRATEGDADLHEYLEWRLRLRGKPEDVWAHLGWTPARGRRVDRRFRRLRAVVTEREDLRENVFESGRPGISGASATWFVERFYSGLAVYQHLPPMPSR